MDLASAASAAVKEASPGDPWIGQVLESAFEELFYYRGLLAALEGRPHRRPRFAVRTFIYRRIFASRWRSAVWKFRRMLWKGIRSVYFGY